MSSFDPKTGILILGELPLDPVINKYPNSDQYKSYMRYLESGLQDDISEILIPALNTLLADKDTVFSSTGSSFTVNKESNYLKHLMNTVKLSLLQENAVNTFNGANGALQFTIGDKKLSAFTLLELPFMDKGGMMYNAGKIYTIINTLTLDDALTFDGSKLKFVDGAHSLLFSGAVNPKVTMFNSSVSMIDFLVMLAKSQYGDDLGSDYSKEFVNNLRSASLLSFVAGTETDHRTLGSQEAFEFALDQLTGRINDQRAVEFGLQEKIDQGYLSTTSTRRSLNEILSFRNALGRTISRDIVASDGRTIAITGDTVTELMVSLLNGCFIDTIHVKRSVNMVGLFVASPLFLGDSIIKGTPVIPQMVRLIPSLKDYTIAPETYKLENNQVLVIDRNTIITENLCECLEYLGIEYFEYKDKITSKKILKAYFEEEYVNNRHYPITDVDVDDTSEYDAYVYVDIHGDISPEQENLTCHDVAALISLYMKLQSGNHYNLLSDPDAGLRKRVEQCYDHFHKAFLYATTNLVKRGGAGIKRLADNKVDFNDSDKMNAAFRFFSKDFFRCLQSVLKVTDVLNITNPVAAISSLTKINTIVKNDDSIADSMRRLTMGHYGRICPYETPQSKKLGVVNNTAIGCEIEDGIMYTNYYPITHSGGKHYLSRNAVRLSVTQEEKYRIADLAELNVNYDTMEVTAIGRVLARVPAVESLEKMTVANIDLLDVQYVNVSLNQHESIACTTVPYAGSDDAARVSFGLSMVKQAKGLVRGETPIVCTTGFLNIPNMNTYYKIFAEGNGRIDVVTSTMIVVRYDGESEPVKYTFEPMTISSTTTIVRVSEVVVGDRVVQGQTLVSSNFIKDGMMVIGVNALVADMTDGYNYEDGIPGSRRISIKTTSYGVHTDSFSIARTTIRASAQDVRYENYIGKDDRLFTKRERLGKSTEYSTATMRAERCRGFVAGVEYVRDEVRYGQVKEIKVRSVSFDELNESDKICNRHGNKGVVCKIHENSDMPYFENGEFIDLKYNPNGVVSRMNIGQKLEAPIGLACYVLGIQVMCDSFNSPENELVRLLLSYTVDLANSDNEDKVFSEYSQLPKELHEHCRNNIRNIRHWRNTFNKEGRAYLIDPVSGKRSLTRVTVGVNYVYKLVQEGEGKIHSRGGFLSSPYVFKTESPTKGASNDGGQRMGYMELDAMASYGAQELLREVTNERGDNYVARNNTTVKALHSGETEYLLDESSAIRRSTEWMFQLFYALGCKVSSDDTEINLSHPEKRKYYKRRALLDASFDGDEREEDIETKMFDAFKSLRGGK